MGSATLIRLCTENRFRERKLRRNALSKAVSNFLIRPIINGSTKAGLSFTNAYAIAQVASGLLHALPYFVLGHMIPHSLQVLSPFFLGGVVWGLYVMIACNLALRPTKVLIRKSRREFANNRSS